MINRHSLFPTLLISALLFIASCNQKPEFEKSTSFPVDPFIGSGGHGHVFVGANVPFGAIQLGPSNIYKGWDWCSGYHYSDSILIGMYAHGNEPSHHIAYLYAYAGQQWKTAEKVRYILDEFYTTGVDGLIGNEDCGQMSAWYVMSSLGFYPVHPANGVYVFGSPLMDKATIHLPERKTCTIESVNNSDKNIYIQSVELNGEQYNKSFITYSELVKGGELKFFMGPEPNYAFGADSANRPVSEL